MSAFSTCSNGRNDRYDHVFIPVWVRRSDLSQRPIVQLATIYIGTRTLPKRLFRLSIHPISNTSTRSNRPFRPLPLIHAHNQPILDGKGVGKSSAECGIRGGVWRVV